MIDTRNDEVAYGGVATATLVDQRVPSTATLSAGAAKPTMSKKEAERIVGGLSAPGILPGYSWSIPREYCRRGKTLSKVEGTICSKCYAGKGKYKCPFPTAALQRRYEHMYATRWVEAMTCLLAEEELFRWFDCGDLQDISHLRRIVAVCWNTPDCRHWLATREREMVRTFLASNLVPANLNIRISADRIDQPPGKFYVPGCTLSTVTSRGYMHGAHNCPLSVGGKDLEGCAGVGCLACWNKEVLHVNYLLH